MKKRKSYRKYQKGAAQWPLLFCTYRWKGNNVAAEEPSPEPAEETPVLVAEALGVSRQAVAKWGNGASDPGTSNLIAPAKLLGISAKELLQGVDL